MILPFTREALLLKTQEVAAERPMSLSGAQPKCSMVLKRGKYHIAQPGEIATHLFKPYPKDSGFQFASDLPANEYLTMQIAKRIFKIRTADCLLAHFSDGEPLYITKRFDRSNDGLPLCQEDFAQLLGGDKYEGSYEEIADYIKENSKAPIVDLIAFFKLILFNLLFSNADSHKKNFSFLEYEKGDYRLSPAYDLLNTALHIRVEPSRMALEFFKDDYESEFFQRNGFYGCPDFILFGERLEIPSSKIFSILKFFQTTTSEVLSQIEASALSPDAKDFYRSSYLDRLRLFVEIIRNA